MFKRFTIVLYLILNTSFLFAQKYGNEWIDFSLKYSKITINEEGLYKITYDDVISKALQNGVLDPNKFQLFNKGVEIPLNITGTQDNIFNQGDEIYFYGTKNDASLDKILYSNQADLPNDDVSLFTDENYYYLTYNPLKNGLRYNNLSLNTSGLTPETYIIAKNRLNFSSTYYPGEYILDAMSLSEYIEGEGYLGETFSKGQNLNYQLNTSNFLNSGYISKLSFYVAGRSNAASTNNLGQNHHLRVSYNSNSLFDSLYRGYQTIRKTIPISISSSTTNISLSSIDDLGAVTDFQAPGYVEISYSRDLNISGLKNLSFKIDKTKSLTFLSFSSSILTTPVIIEKNGLNFYQPSGSNGVQFVLNNTSAFKNYFLTDQSLAKSVTLNDVTFKNINSATSKNYLIISHNSLKDGAEAYQQYNTSIGNPTSLVYTEDLYNEFYYGFHHPLALRNYCSFMIDKGNIKPEYLLLLGKGNEYPKYNLSIDLVPTMGFPASDNLIVDGLNTTLAIGRVPAKTNLDINAYIEKVKSYRNQPNALWRKNIIHVSGGKSLSENLSFINYQKSFETIAKDKFFGGNIVNYQKNLSDPIANNLTENILKTIQNGASMLSFLGHGSTTATEINFGEPFNVNNPDKLLFYLVNGCSTGNIFGTYSLSEQYIFQEKEGAIGWIGTTSEGVASYLNAVSQKFYQNCFNLNYGRSVAYNLAESLKGTSTDKLTIAHKRQYIFIGDPSLSFYSPLLSDPSITNQDVFFNDSDLSSSSSFLNLNVIVSNIGKAIPDSLQIRIKRVLPNQKTIDYGVFTVPSVFNKDTLHFKLSNSFDNTGGINSFTITLDPNQKIQELSELNNSITVNINLKSNEVTTIYPLKDEIYSNPTLKLEAQNTNLFAKNLSYIFELDTLNSFKSAFKKAATISDNSLFPTWSPQINLINNQVYFWRVKVNDPQGIWKNSTFTYILNSDSGWIEQKYEQFQNLELRNLTLDSISKKIEFVKTAFITSIQTRGDDANKLIERAFRKGPGEQLSYRSEFDGISIFSFSFKEMGALFSYPSKYNAITNGAYSGQYYFDLNLSEDRDSLISYISKIPIGYYVLGYNGNNLDLQHLPTDVKNAFLSLGLSKFNSIKLGEPYSFWVQKGNNTYQTDEITSDYASITPPREQIVKHTRDLLYPFDNGYLITEKIGPSLIWRKALFDISKTVDDNLSFDIIGVDTLSNQVYLFANQKNEEIDIKSIDAKLYPYIRLKISNKNSTSKNFPLIKALKVNYTPQTDLTFNTSFKFELLSNELQEGDSLKINIGILNNGSTSGILKPIFTVVKENRVEVNTVNPTEIKFAPKENRVLSFKISSFGYSGDNILKINLNPKIKIDQYVFNNNVQVPFKVIKDTKEPLIDVVFDGKHIINGEIVSPLPLINVLLKDENKFLELNDTTALNLYIKTENSAYKRINFSSGHLIIQKTGTQTDNKILFKYQPLRLDDGIYTLKANFKDKTGNTNSNAYESQFEVINERSISKFYPYPNPVVNNMKFVFTLTGDKIPDQIRIRLYTSSGKIVREISKDELGDLRIGNNVSNFTWDGTDMFGDRLANGVYFYSVEVKDGTENYKNKNTTGEKYFKNDMGKIYLLR